MTRTGKIARLPINIRHKLNTRLDNGDLGATLVEWLNSQKEVRGVLAAHFDSRPINEQNLTEWKQGGFLDWQRQQEACERVRGLVELSDELDDTAGRRTISNRLAGVLAAELAAEVSKRLDETTDPRERWQYLCDALRQLKDLRQGDQIAARAKMEFERWEIECKKRAEKDTSDKIQKLKDQATKPIWDALKRATVAKVFGGGEAAENVADYLLGLDQIPSNPEPSAPVPPTPPCPPSPLGSEASAQDPPAQEVPTSSPSAG
jgi:hypothetical protein